MKTPRPTLALLLMVSAASISLCGLSFLAGCQENLFTDSDAMTRSRINRYYNRDSALETSESRKRGADLGFGLPTGGQGN